MTKEEECRHRAVGLVCAIARMEPWDQNERWPACIFCGLDRALCRGKRAPHGDDCAWRLAREIAAGIP